MKKFLLLVLVLTVSCNLPEHYFTERPVCANETFTLTPESLKEVSQSINLDRLKSSTPIEYRYFFKTFIETEEQTYMLTSFAKNDDCFLVKMLVDKWDKLGGMRRTNGVSYPNELFDLTWEIKTIDGHEEVVFVDMHKIID